ncbi:Uncharacterised protein [Vibrio cholerae]|nr:hypothetical protein VCNHCC008D_000534 [Vibrio cholerae O1 str. NHCC-008D]CSB84110.1 Uncharacterised protein [Vibrio cholerae]
MINKTLLFDKIKLPFCNICQFKSLAASQKEQLIYRVLRRGELGICQADLEM